MRLEQRVKPHHVYRLFDEAGALLYIGVTCDLRRRLYEHRRDARLRPPSEYHEAARRFRHWSATEYPTRPEALAAERAATEAEHPQFNIKYRSAA